MKRSSLLGIFLFSLSLAFGQRTITGTVTDNAGTPLGGVSVSAKGTRIGTSTNANGDCNDK